MLFSNFCNFICNLQCKYKNNYNDYNIPEVHLDSSKCYFLRLIKMNYCIGITTYPKTNIEKFRVLLTSLLVKFNSNVPKDYIRIHQYFKLTLHNLKVTNIDIITELIDLMNKVIRFKDNRLTSYTKRFSAIRTNDTIEFIVFHKAISVDHFKFVLLNFNADTQEMSDFVGALMIAHYYFFLQRVKNDKHNILLDRRNFHYAVTAVNTMNWICQHENDHFKSCKDVLDSLLHEGFVKSYKSNIDIEVIIDGISGLRYKNVEDFIKRMDERDYKKIFGEDKDYANYIKDHGKSLSDKDRENISKYFDKNNDVQDSLQQLQTTVDEFEILVGKKIQRYGTLYHTNVMINRNLFLKKNYNKYTTFLDDDDFSSSIDERFFNFKLYQQYTTQIFKALKPEINRLLSTINRSHPGILTNDIDEFRKIMYNLLNGNTTNKIRSLLLKDVYKFGIFRQRSIVKTEETILGKSTQSYQKSVHCCGLWSSIIPPYLPKNFMNVQEMSSDDVGYIIAHDSFHNHLPITLSPVYYYISSGFKGYGNINDINHVDEFKKMQRHRLTILDNYIKTLEFNESENYGRYYYTFDSIVETSIGNQFVANKFNKLKINTITNIDDYNDKLVNKD